jgi:hypothetical protein
VAGPSASTRCRPTASDGSRRARDRILRGARADHQARGVEHAVAMRALDRRVHARMQPEVVRGEDQRRAARCVVTNQASCARRKRKNSTPSRRRRFIMSQLVSISRTISQIFDGRK